MLVIALSGGAAGCADRTLTRDQLEDRYVSDLVESGIEEDVAACVIEGFFDELTDAELRDFNLDGDELTPAEQQRIAELTLACAG